MSKETIKRMKEFLNTMDTFFLDVDDEKLKQTLRSFIQKYDTDQE